MRCGGRACSACPQEAEISDAVAAAGGFGPRVDATATQSLNLAARLTDGQQIHVPALGDRPAQQEVGSLPGGASGSQGAPAGPVNVNTATQSELEALPGIGPATAAKIIAARTEQAFRSVAELRERKVVGAATLEKIKNLVTVQ